MILDDHYTGRHATNGNGRSWAPSNGISAHQARSNGAADSSRQSAAGSLPATDLPRIEAAVREILLALGEDPQREGLLDTPARVARAYRDLFAGLHESPAQHLARQFEHEGTGTVVLRDIEFHSLCEHHLLPFTGKAHIAYVPANGRVVGLSKLARTVDVFARRPQLQERLTCQIADALMAHLDPAGVMVIVEAEHFCMKMRGAQKCCSSMTTTESRGIFRADPEARREALSLLLPGH
ncbi:MAG: GTP cyclohydrolase I FolE [Planctomycetes bacterium]|nr:GTP cyclohydrolase I FolE [Planctomycetota bacterium]NOG55782.1 GTP cyclohydrolase I FolE [Planctomycetota bacterium]